MYSLLFRNKLAALAFVALIVIGAALLIGTEQEQGVIQETAQTIAEQRTDFDETVKQAGVPKPGRPTIMADPEPASVPLADDDALIDEAIGFDPTPVDPTDPFDPKAIAETEEVVIVLKNERKED